MSADNILPPLPPLPPVLPTAALLAALEAEQAALRAKMEAPSIVPAQAPLVLRSAADLQRMTFAPVRYVVLHYVAEGCTIIGGKPKVGKSWFTLDAGLAVASGGSCFGVMAEQGDVLCLALEDNERRLRSRVQKILGKDVPWPARFQYAIQWPRAEEGGLVQIRSWIKSVPTPRLVVVAFWRRSDRPRGKAKASMTRTTIL
jgi:hypothetical protein